MTFRLRKEFPAVALLTSGVAFSSTARQPPPTSPSCSASTLPRCGATLYGTDGGSPSGFFPPR